MLLTLLKFNNKMKAQHQKQIGVVLFPYYIFLD